MAEVFSIGTKRAPQFQIADILADLQKDAAEGKIVGFVMCYVDKDGSLRSAKDYDFEDAHKMISGLELQKRDIIESFTLV